jgi:uncharacterized membrane protein
MRERLDRVDFAALAAMVGTFVGTAISYDRLPEAFPVHAGIDGRIDGWGARATAIWLMPVLAVAIWASLRFGYRLLPAAWRERMEQSPLSVVAAVTAALLVGLHWVFVLAALRGRQDVGNSPMLLLGSFALALSLVMPRIRRNPWIGVRTTWTLTSDENWARTHRLASIAFALGGAFSIAAALAGFPEVAGIGLLAAAFAPAVHSFVIARWPTKSS